MVEECLDRIAATDRRIGAFALVDADGARRAAEALAGRADLPLAGVPVAIKDNLDVAGLPTRYGSASTVDTPAGADDPMVARLRAAGAVIIGKTRMPELAIWGFTESRASGGTRNPRDPSRNAGGSTGGGAAAVAAGMVPLAVGSDGGGSLRIPAQGTRQFWLESDVTRAGRFSVDIAARTRATTPRRSSNAATSRASPGLAVGRRMIEDRSDTMPALAHRWRSSSAIWRSPSRNTAPGIRFSCGCWPRTPSFVSQLSTPYAPRPEPSLTSRVFRSPRASRRRTDDPISSAAEATCLAFASAPAV